MESEANKKLRVLLIEDEPTQWFYMKRMLAPHYEVQHATNGIDALRLLDSHTFDVVLMDINLGDDHLSGFHLVNYIRQQEKFSSLRILAVTGETLSSRDGHSVFNFSSFDMYIQKPVDKAALLEAIDGYVPVKH